MDLVAKPSAALAAFTCLACRRSSQMHRFSAAVVTTQLWPVCAFAPWVAARSLCLLLGPDGLACLPATGVASNLASLNRGTGSLARICAHLWPKRENFALAAWSIQSVRLACWCENTSALFRLQAASRLVAHIHHQFSSPNLMAALGSIEMTLGPRELEQLSLR